MADQQFSVKFIGDDGSLKKSINELEKDLQDFNKSLKMAGSVDALKSATKGIRETEAAMALLRKTAAGGIRTTDTATQSLVNLSRVAQDAPYGFIGIANNLNPLLESFQRLRIESGSTGGALKSLGSSLLGAGGIGLALGVASSLLVTFGDKLFSSGNSAKDQANKLRDAKAALADYVTSLEDVTQARLVGAQNAQEELVRLRTLYEATQNANIPLADRKRLVDQLQEQYPKYFANIKDEVILAGGAKDAYNKLATAILSAARARAAQDALVELQKTGLTLEQQNLQAQQKQFDAQEKLNALKRSGNKETSLSLSGEERLTSFGVKIIKAQEALNDAKKETAKIAKEIFDIDRRSKILSDEVTSQVQADPNSLLKPTGTLKADKVKAKAKEIEVTGPVKFVNTIPLEEEPDALPFRIKDPKPRNIVLTFNQSALDKQIAQFNADLTKLVESTQENLFINIGESIGALFSGGGFDGVVRSIGAILGDFLQSLGKMLIQAAVTVQAFKKAFAALLKNPVAAIAVGIGLVAIGGAIKTAAMPKPKGFASGGLAFGPTLGLVGEGSGTSRSNPEVIAPLDKLKNYLGGDSRMQLEPVRFEISGDKLIGVARVAQNKQNKFR